MGTFNAAPHWQTLGDLVQVLSGRVPPDARPRFDLAVGGRGDFWDALIGLADGHRLVPALWSSLLRQGLAKAPPAPLRPFLPPDSAVLQLEACWEGNRQRIAAMLGQTRALISGLNAAGIEPLLLKGASNVLAGLYPDPAARWMVDIDMLVRPDEIARAEAAMAAMGYRPYRDDPGAPHHRPALYRPGDTFSVEPHFLPLLPPADRGLPNDASWRHALPVEEDGLRYRHLSPDHRVLHNVLGAQVQDHGYTQSRLQLRALWDLTHIVAAHGDALDWERIAAAAAEAGFPVQLELHLLQAQKLFGLAWPLARPPSYGARMRWLSCVAALRAPPRMRPRAAQALRRLSRV